MAYTLTGKTILVTGASGLVGTHALLRLKNMKDVKVRAVYHQQEPNVFSDNITYVQADLTDMEKCREVVKNIDVVMMFAAKIDRHPSSLEYLIAHLIMHMRMLEAAYQAEVEKFIWLSSTTVYPYSDNPLEEKQVFDGDPPKSYFSLGWATRYIETLCRMYATHFDRKMLTIVLRSAGIYGEYGDFNLSHCHVLHSLIRKVVERHKPLRIWGGGETKRDFIYVDDVIDACFMALEKIDNFVELNIGLGKSYSVGELLKEVLTIGGYTEAEIVLDKSNQDQKPSILLDCRKVERLIGFYPKTTLHEGIKKTMIWLENVLINENSVLFES